MSLRPLDLIVILLYFVVIGTIGFLASRGQNTTAKFFTAERSLPGWVVAFTLMGAIIGTGTFIGHPGAAYQKGLFLFLPQFVLPVVFVLVAKYVVPFYRRVIRMSAYEYIGLRFGLGGRLYTSFGFLVDRIFDIGVTLVTAALAVNVLTGWELKAVILGVALFTAAYTLLGGIKAVVWTDVAQGTILILGGLLVLLRLLFAPEAGAPFAVVGEAWRGGRFTFGSWDFSWASLFDTQVTTVWLFTAAMAVQFARRYATDQHMVQRYLIARSDAEASRATFVGAMICLPVFSLFMLIGTCLYGFFALTRAPVPEIADSVMPYFMGHYLPAGVLGLVMAGVLAAAMSTVSSDLNSVSTVATTDYVSVFLPRLSNRARLLFGRLMVLAGGLLSGWAAIMLIPGRETAPISERVLTIGAILSGGKLGLFALGFGTRSATRRGCYIGIACCVVFTAWAILTEPTSRLLDLGWNFEMNPILIGVFGHFVLFGTGWLASRLCGGYRPENVVDLTFWSPRTRDPR
ncbi:MAG: sodium/solute symporter [Opitutaceae bacterium]|nr:sodium/solute symporter [Opitutaceae bacterium]